MTSTKSQPPAKSKLPRLSFGGKGRQQGRRRAPFSGPGDFGEDIPLNAFDDPEYYTGIVWNRLIAHLIDAVILLILAVPLALLLVFGIVVSLGLLAIPLTIAYLGARVIYYAGFTGGAHSATPGMRLMGIEVRCSDGGRPDHGQAFVRVGIYYATISFLSPLVLLAALFNHQRRALHDFLSGTIVVNRIPR